MCTVHLINLPGFSVVNSYDSSLKESNCFAAFHQNTVTVNEIQLCWIFYYLDTCFVQQRNQWVSCMWNFYWQKGLFKKQHFIEKVSLMTTLNLLKKMHIYQNPLVNVATSREVELDNLSASQLRAFCQCPWHYSCKWALRGPSRHNRGR